ncbi:Non-heme dioxygenase N-terminal domain-containing protein [Cynara cardunculus var. scolymus]|uniref:Non-heme dioxygenase N-terminal domain-containing protein n=1 Tax=Cynara cardunculus var. scolymus TaxID=59895 RepID=A0A124SAV1_CYNCS|nr:Non-heme dioxygenase N-terminal domain-containing protein [Cynara cardunculus var. scolymus]
MGFLAEPKIPVIHMVDMKKSRDCRDLVCSEVRHALEEYGCFFVVCNGSITEEVNREVFDVLETLFDLPMETKIKNTSEKAYHGYIGQLPFLPLLESMGIEHAASVHGLYAKLVSEIEETVRKIVFESYGLNKYHESYNESVTYLLRVMKYRPPNTNETKLGSMSHTDKTFISILSQNQVKGLEVKTKDNNWIPVIYPPSSFLVMAGDAFKVPEELVDDAHPRKFNSFDHFGYLDFYDKDSMFDQEYSHVKSFCGV